jgi:hypothetical protein
MTYWCVNYVIAIDLARGRAGRELGGAMKLTFFKGIALALLSP